MRTVLLALQHVEKRYDAGEISVIALREINLAVTRGEFVAIMGASGSGKSTLMNILGCLDLPTRGKYTLAGTDVRLLDDTDLAAVRNRLIGFVFQSFNLIEDLTVYENIELPLLYQNAPRAQRKARVREVLELVDLLPRARHKPAQLSGGQQQRVAVARAVVTDPKLILADEPTGNLDTRNGEEVMGMLDILNQQGATVLMVTHSHEHAARARRIVSMVDGRIANQTHVAARRGAAEAARA